MDEPSLIFAPRNDRFELRAGHPDAGQLGVIETREAEVDFAEIHIVELAADELDRGNRTPTASVPTRTRRPLPRCSALIQPSCARNASRSSSRVCAFLPRPAAALELVDPRQVRDVEGADREALLALNLDPGALIALRPRLAIGALRHR